MDNTRASTSALIAAFVRAHHATHDEPKVFDDYLAAQLFTDEQRTLFERNLAEALKFFDPEQAALHSNPKDALAAFMRVQSGPITLSRARYAEDALDQAVERGTRQYVILGAGLDTFAFRRPDLMKRLHVFEIDHPATQEFKLRRLAELGWDTPEQLHYLPLDFTTEGLAAALARSRFDPTALSFFSWLGVSYYLSRAVMSATLSAIAGIAPAGSAIVFDYLDADAFAPDKAARRVQLMKEATRRSGEPMIGSLDPAGLAADLEPLGLELRENLTPANIEARYFAQRTDGFHAFEHVHFARVEVRHRRGLAYNTAGALPEAGHPPS